MIFYAKERKIDQIPIVSPLLALENPQIPPDGTSIVKNSALQPKIDAENKVVTTSSSTGLGLNLLSPKPKGHLSNSTNENGAKTSAPSAKNSALSAKNNAPPQHPPEINGHLGNSTNEISAKNNAPSAKNSTPASGNRTPPQNATVSPTPEAIPVEGTDLLVTEPGCAPSSHEDAADKQCWSTHLQRNQPTEFEKALRGLPEIVRLENAAAYCRSSLVLSQSPRC